MPTTSEEQYLLELLNEARLNPLGNALRYISSYDPLSSSDASIAQALSFYKVDGTALLSALRALPAAGALAWNDSLATAAEQHSAAMIAANEQSHQVKGEAVLSSRVETAGYTGYKALGENVYGYALSSQYAHAAFMVDWGEGVNGMQSPAGHRNNIMSSAYTEVGIDISAERNTKTAIGPNVVTQDFGSRGKLYITGVAFTDGDRNSFYTIGEGVQGLTITSGNASTSTSTSGGYSLEVPTGSQVVTLSGGSLTGVVTIATTIGSENLKLDVVNSSTLLTSGSISVMSGPVSLIKLISIKGATITTGAGNQDIRGNEGNDVLIAGAGNDKLTGNAGNDELYGGEGNDDLFAGAGDDIIDGGGGTDTAYFTGLRSSYTTANLTGGGISITGPLTGTDLVRNVEFFMFDDGQFTLAQLGGTANFAPTLTTSQAITTSAGAAKTLTVAAVDPDGDKLTYTASAAAHGTITKGATDGVFIYTPTAGFSGSDAFRVTVSDGRGGTSFQSVQVTVKAANSAPTVAATQAIALAQDASKQVTVAASDIDGDVLSYSAGAAGHGVVTGGVNGVFTYKPVKGYAGADSFVVTVSDGQGGSVQQTVNVNVSQVAPPLGSGGSTSTQPFKLFAADGLADGVGGTGTVLGTNGFQDVTLLDSPGTITFDASFNKGGDVIRLSHAANFYKITFTGSNAQITGGGATYLIPLGATGVVLNFTDGARKLYFDGVDKVGKIGSQAITDVAVQITAPTDNSPIPTGENGAAKGTVFLSSGADVLIDGDHNVFGTTTGNEIVRYHGGSLVLDASFNKGGDTLHLNEAAADFRAYISGSTVVLVSAEGSVTIPVGPVGLKLDFDGDERIVKFDAAAGKLLIGSQAITALTLATANGLDGDSGISLDVGTVTVAKVIELDDGENYTLSDSANATGHVVIHGFDNGDVIRISGATLFDYNFSKIDFDNDGQADDIEITYNTNTVNNLIYLTDVISNQSVWVSDATTAKQAVGSQFIVDASSPSSGSGGTPVEGTGTSLDVGSQSVAQVIQLAGQTDYVLTDNAGQSGNAVIHGFNAGDVIEVSGASAGDYNFSKLDYDQDGQADDIEITFSTGGVNNLIYLIDAVTNPNVFVNTLQSAESAIGSQFITF